MKGTRCVGRRRFGLEAALAVLGSATITISSSGCGGGGSSPTSPSAPGDKVGSVSANHGHAAVITAAQLSTGAALTLQIRGSSDHPHTVVLSAGEVAQVAAGSRVSKNSSVDDGHDHTVTFN
ncbi:MAG: hypothetical protein KJ067_09575 [Vicinamibacteria bacterium]|nr:hypothetical protein [Vicinamibacteria bacterium]